MQRLRSVLLAVSMLPLLGNPAVARTITVHAGDSIRAALSIARPGDRVQVLPGVYHEGVPDEANAITISTSGIALVGLSSPTRPVVLENAGQPLFGIWVSPSDSTGPEAASDPEHPTCGLSGARIDGFSLSGFTVRDLARMAYT